jgi:hypothetical protein
MIFFLGTYNQNCACISHIAHTEYDVNETLYGHQSKLLNSSQAAFHVLCDYRLNTSYMMTTHVCIFCQLTALEFFSSEF